MTKKALEKLNEKQMTYCKTISALIARARANGLKEEFERNSGKLRASWNASVKWKLSPERKSKRCISGSLRTTGTKAKREENLMEFEINNQRKIQLTQTEPDGAVTVTTWEAERNGVREVESEYQISPGDFVMMLNWYRYQKENGNPNLNF